MANRRGRALAASRELEQARVAVPDAKPFVTFDDVSIRLRDAIVFEGLCWEILDDQQWAVVGPNGSGKSILMQALAGALPVVKGKIVYHWSGGAPCSPPDGIALVTFESQRAVIGDDSFYQARWNIGVDEGAQPVSEYLSEQGVARVNRFQVVETRPDATFEARRRDVVESLELGHLLQRSLIQLSNGERRKVTIARALLKQPRLLILDNPYAGLDERFRVKLSASLDTLMRGALRVIVVGTSRDELPSGITHVLAVQDCRVVGRYPRSAAPGGEAAASAPGSFKLADVRAAGNGRNGTVAAAPALVRMNDVCVVYNGSPVLEHVSWTVRQNEQWALLGPNGAGKTTLLSLILADNPQAYANDVTLFGRRRGSGESIWEIKKSVGWVAPELQLYYPRDATCLDVVCSGWFDSVGLYSRCTGEQRQAAVEWLQRFGLSDRADTALHRMSEGEQRLALLGRALVKSPTLLVLDEPTQGLDTANRDRVLQAVDAACRRPNISMIYVTHRADELPQTISHVLRLDAGRVVEQGKKRA